MAQYDVHRNPDPRTKTDVPFLLDVQSDVLSVLATRMVVPLYTDQAMASRTLTRLTPRVSLKDRTLVAVVPEMAGISARGLGRVAGNLTAFRADVLQAIDLLLTGF